MFSHLSSWGARGVSLTPPPPKSARSHWDTGVKESKPTREEEEAQLLRPAAAAPRCLGSRSPRGVPRPYLGWAPPALVPKVAVHRPPEFKAPALRPRHGPAHPSPVPSRSRRPHPPGPTPCQESGQTPSWELTSLPGPGTSPPAAPLCSRPAGISQRAFAGGRGRRRPGSR